MRVKTVPNLKKKKSSFYNQQSWKMLGKILSMQMILEQSVIWAQEVLKIDSEPSK